MRNTRQRPLGSEGGEALALQKIMEIMRAPQKENKEYRQEQERTREEAQAMQERLREEARADHERLQARLMAKIAAS